MSDTKNGKPTRYVAGMSEAELREKYDVDRVIKLGSNEGALGPSPAALCAVADATKDLHRYPPPADDVLREALAQKLGHGATPDQIATGNGGCEILSLIAYAFVTEGDECIVSTPTFPVYMFTAQRAGASIVDVGLSTQDFLYQPERILEAISGDTRIIYICSPNNPTGTTITAAEFDAIMQAIPERVIVVLDEVYHHFVSAEKRLDPIPYIRENRNLIILHSFSKAYGLAGCRLGYVVGPPPLVEKIRMQRNPFHLSQLTMAAGVAATGDEKHLTNTIALVRGGRDWLSSKLTQIGARVWPSEGNFVLFKTDRSGPETVDALMKHGIIIRPMENFGLPDYMRVTIGTPEENQRFVDTLTAVLNHR